MTGGLCSAVGVVGGGLDEGARLSFQATVWDFCFGFPSQNPPVVVTLYIVDAKMRKAGL